MSLRRQVQTDGSKTPDEAVSQSLLHLHEEFTDIRNQFEVSPLQRCPATLATLLRCRSALTAAGLT